MDAHQNTTRSRAGQATWRIGDRTAVTGTEFMKDLGERLRVRVQLTSDGHRAYFKAVEEAFGCEVDYAMLANIYA